MTNEAHLESYRVTLTTQSPVFVGSGTSVKKSEYCYFPDKQEACFLDKDKFFAFLVEKNLMEQYEEFIFSASGDLTRFLQSCGYGYDDIRGFMLYSTDAGDALDENKSIKDIHCFMRNQKNQAYIPGSSLKGALRTVLLTKLIADSRYPGTVDMRNKWSAQMAEQHYLNRLNLNPKRKGDILNDIMRTISVSDSEPIDNSNLTLCIKQDVAPDGRMKKINVVRECIRPGVDVHFALTIDKSYGDYISIEDLRTAIAQFADKYFKEYLRFFPGAKAGTVAPGSIFIGGGSGYFSKNIVYPILGHERALPVVADYMKFSFRNHKHEADLKLGISPKKLKCTSYHNARYQFGLCRIEIT